MKKIIIIALVCLVGLCAKAETLYIHATSASIKLQNKNWSNWEPVDFWITIDTNNDFIRFYTQEGAYFKIISSGDSYIVPKGGTAFNCKAIDDEGRVCQFRFRKDNDGDKQLYLDYNDVSIVYNVK